MRSTLLTGLFMLLGCVAHAQSIALTSFSSFDDNDVLFAANQPTIANDILVSAKSITIDVARTSKKDMQPRYVEVLVRYDDLNREKQLMRIDSSSVDSTFSFTLEWAEGRKVKDIEVYTSTKNGALQLTSVSYVKGGKVVDWTSTDLKGTGFADRDNALQNDILVISSPIDSPPHLTKLHKPKVKFVASLANSEGEGLTGKGELTCYLIDMSEESVSTKKFDITGTPQTFTIDLSDKDMTYGYLVTFQPVMGQPWVAIRSMEVMGE